MSAPRIPPVALTIITAAGMWLTAWLVPTLAYAMPASRIVALCLALVGIVIGISGVVSFRRAATTVNPLRPETTSSLVVSGIYRYSRNPMYLGLLLVLLGWAVFLSNAVAFVWLPAFVFYMNRFQIDPEETALAALFGPAFEHYRTKVRRWL